VIKAIVLTFLLAMTGSSFAQEAPLRALISADDAKAWQGVGRINMKDAGFCTGTLIAADLVLTAAHCMYHPLTGKLLEPENISFLAGWRNGRAVAQRTAKTVIVHKKYTPGRDVAIDKVAHDLALIRLLQPISPNVIKGFERRGIPRAGENVKVVSYAENRAEAPSIEDLCHVMGEDPRAVVLTCDVDHGSSGSPIFVIEDGTPKIASVVSAKAVVGGQKVALGAMMDAPLSDLMAQLNDVRGAFQGKRPGRQSLAQQLGRVQ